MKRLIRKAIHDDMDRDAALVYIDGKVFEGETHADGIQEYLASKGVDSESEVYDRFDAMSEFDEAGFNAEEIVFAALDNGDVFIQTVGDGFATPSDNLVMQAAAAFKAKYPNAKIYDDDTHEEGVPIEEQEGLVQIL